MRVNVKPRAEVHVQNAHFLAFDAVAARYDHTRTSRNSHAHAADGGHLDDCRLSWPLTVDHWMT